ncbi:putative basic-leucine zipper transcription factor [Cavenderia fasciculata]|uniref:Basic-leucine zipper transcription factor n=1 Tax=Cavenderia fasciculata TaxID=261658 RepID=F4QDA6_CACFS|nr:putative basic-leucine zipper transcription factor [Cavenderia fasciculata]EGG13734.1 putative basic-leucine zipper transcription factor [Cavenderia fasciculata]|eukprot:XP_004350438.1 putative basic-leucine zipper transcription factor [Cavenderia fasciculata]
MNFSSDFINISNEIESFNNTLNEMLSVWNDPNVVPQNNVVNKNNNNSINNNNNMMSLNSSQQLEANINLILNNNNNNNNNSTNSNNTTTNTTIFKQSQPNHGRSFLVSSNSHLESFLLDNPSLFQSDDAIGKMSKVINEINRESKGFQPVEIVPLKNFSTAAPSTEQQPSLPSFSSIPSFSLDTTKLEELKTDLSFLDPILSIPYANHNNMLPILNNNQPTTMNIIPTPQLQQQQQPQQQQQQEPIYNIDYNQNNNNNNIQNDMIDYIMPIKQENNSGPIRHANQFDRSPVQPDSTMVTLSTAQLSSFTSMEMEDYATASSVGKNLSTSERKDIRRQKRLIKNRESAHLSRQRKRERLTDLEHHVEELTQNSSKLTGLLGGLENENLVLNAEVSQLVDVIKDSPVLSALFVHSTFGSLRNNQPYRREVQVTL